jgi:serine/threonine-protein kinase
MDSTTLVSQLQALGLWPEHPPLRQSLAALARQIPEGKRFARELLQRGLLTPFQANQIFAGKGQELVVGPYLLLERLGEGASGHVYKARHRLLHRVVALKLIRPERVANPTALRRFQREVKAAAKLSHPNVVRAYDADHAGTVCYFTMQYVPGTTLKRRVEQSGQLPVTQACDFMRQAALGLQHLHEHGMVHRDIKPSNLVITELDERQLSAPPDPLSLTLVPGQVKLLDLGLARLSEGPGEGAHQATLTQLGTVMGTTDYMSPEQGRDSRAVDARSDLYSLGCTLYHALTGKPPFPGGTSMEKLMRHQLDEPEPVTRLRPEVPPALAAVLNKLMAKDPAKRYQTAAEVAAALAPFSGDLEPTLETVPAPPLAIPVAAADRPAPEFAFDSGNAPLVRRPAVTVRARPRRGLGEWAWVGIAAGVAVAVLAFLALLRFLTK